MHCEGSPNPSPSASRHHSPPPASSDALAPVLAERGVPYHPVFTYRDLGIDPL